MDLIVYHLGNVNWVAVLAATVWSFVLGFLWYSPYLFGNQWMKAVGMKKKDMKNKDGMGAMMLTSGLLAFVMAAGLATLMNALVVDGWLNGALLGVLVTVVFVTTSKGVHNLFEPKSSSTLFLLTFGHDVLFLTVAGAIIGAL